MCNFSKYKTVEICVKNTSRLRNKDIKQLFNEYSSSLTTLFVGKLNLSDSLSQHINYIEICMNKSFISINKCKIILHIFRNNMEGMIEEIDDETSTEQVHVANTYSLPNIEFDGLFERYITYYILTNEFKYF